MFRTLAIFGAALFVSVASSQGETILTFSQSGSNVVATASGSVDTAGLDLLGNASSGAFVTASQASVGVGTFDVNDVFGGFTGPVSFGGGGFTNGSASSGSIIGIEGGGDMYLLLPNDYVSGTSLSGTGTWDNTTISGLGLTPGTYTYTWGSGATADSFEVIIPSAATPEPDSFVLLATALAGIGSSSWMTRRRATQPKATTLS